MTFNKLGIIGAACALTLLCNTSALADTATVGVSATVTGTCKFNSGGAVSFTLDPSSAAATAAGTVTQPTFWCTKGTSYTLTDNNGVNASAGAQRMKHGTLAEYIPYTFTYTASGQGQGAAPGSEITLDIASQVDATNYLNASAGSYADTVTLTITP